MMIMNNPIRFGLLDYRAVQPGITAFTQASGRLRPGQTLFLVRGSHPPVESGTGDNAAIQVRYTVDRFTVQPDGNSVVKTAENIPQTLRFPASDSSNRQVQTWLFDGDTLESPRSGQRLNIAA
ncbi:MAG: hypothetical protein K2X01_05210 [Cyanobacteria bacterium]|nr:hypothetical protein [Cyanobacteriota bacterium]